MTIKQIILPLLLIMATGAHAAPDIQEGSWEVVAQVYMPGLPIKIPPITYSQCITQKDLVPKKVQQRGDCKINNINISANTVSWEMVCNTEAGQLNGEGNVTYQKTSFAGSFKMAMPGPKGTMTMTTNMQGHYQGPCQ